MRTVCKVLIILWSIFCFVGLLTGLHNVAGLRDKSPFAELGIAFGVMFWIILWFFPTVGLGVIGLLFRPESHKKSDKTTPRLCANCWLSGDCEREKEAIKKREMIADCRGYFPKNK